MYTIILTVIQTSNNVGNGCTIHHVPGFKSLDAARRAAIAWEQLHSNGYNMKGSAIIAQTEEDHGGMKS